MSDEFSGVITTTGEARNVLSSVDENLAWAIGLSTNMTGLQEMAGAVEHFIDATRAKFDALGVSAPEGLEIAQSKMEELKNQLGELRVQAEALEGIADLVKITNEELLGAIGDISA